MSFLRRVAGRSLRDRVRSSVTREELGVEPLLLHIERSQLSVAWASVSDAPGRLPREVFQACPTGRRPLGKTQDTLERLCLSAGLGTPYGVPYDGFHLGAVPTPSGEEQFDHWLEQAYLMVEENEGSAKEEEKRNRVIESFKGPALEVIKAVRLSNPDVMLRGS
ncbi:hypothetical protein L3Q82_012316 [Scortum barcoo]|uniref:Uncharacterized protein n=1 Tax=Scortum barcoo TaxID=214431 RepID=A0ACB8W2F2_9TELE|nr:hypothetical protein L3Q82_012316 [Scortum barcoo]